MTDKWVKEATRPGVYLSRDFSCINSRRIQSRPSSFGVATTLGADRGKDCLPALKNKANCKGKGILTVGALVTPRWDMLGAYDKGLFDRVSRQWRRWAERLTENAQRLWLSEMTRRTINIDAGGQQGRNEPAHQMGWRHHWWFEMQLVSIHVEERLVTCPPLLLDREERSLVVRVV